MFEVLPGVDRGQGVGLEAEHARALMVDHGLDESALVAEVVVELALAGAGGSADVIEARASGPARGDQLGRGTHDSLAGGAALFGGGSGRNHDAMVTSLDGAVQCP